MSSPGYKTRLIKLIPAVAVIAGLILAVSGVVWLKNYFAQDTAPPKKIVQQITLITPPPPPPKVDEPPPEPEPEENIPEPEPLDQTPDPVENTSADLGVDADGSGAGDNFGLIGKKGGRGLLDGSPFAWYEGLMASELQDQLSKIDGLKSQEYNFRIKLKVGFDGKVERIEMIRSTGDREKDKLLLAALNKFTRFSQMPPGKMPSVVDLRITSSI
jgi:periplasmic protein TonB